MHVSKFNQIKIENSSLYNTHPSQIEEMKSRNSKIITIRLIVYSGRTNPQWSLQEGSDYERFIDLVQSLTFSEELLFNYDEWNRLGYASFLIEFEDNEGVQNAIHVWRDMAVRMQKGVNKIMYALDAADVYDVLVTQAEEREQGRFFVNYHKYREEQINKE